MFHVRIVTYVYDPGEIVGQGHLAPLSHAGEFSTSDAAIAWVKEEQHRTGRCYAVIGDGFRWESSHHYANLKLPVGEAKQQKNGKYRIVKQ